MVDAGANPLVAARPADEKALGGVLVNRPGQEWYSGVWIAEDISQLVDGVNSGDWIDTTIGGVAASMDVLGFVTDPLGSLVSWGVAWLLEHVKPLSDALDWLAGDPAQISAYAQTWHNVAGRARDEATELGDAVARDIPSWTGAAAEAYRAHAGEQQAALAAIGQAAQGLGTIVEGAGLLVSMVRLLVRDLIAEFVSVLAVRLWEWLAEEACTFGIATPLVVAQVGSLVAKWAAKIARLLRGLVNSFRKLAPIIRRLRELITKLKTVLRDLRRGRPKNPHLKDGNIHGPRDKPRQPHGSDGSDPLRSHAENPRDNAVPLDRRRCVGDPIDVATGAVVLTQTDVALPGALPLVLRRSHVSSYRVGGWFGRSWASTLDQRLEVDAEGVCFATEDGMLLVYPTVAAAGAVLPVEGPRWPLTRAGAGYAVSDPERGWTWHFQPRQPDAGAAPAGAVPAGAAPAGGVPAGAAPAGAVPADGATLRLPLTAISDRNGGRIELSYGNGGDIAEVRHGGYRVAVDTADGRVVGLRLPDASTGVDETLVRFGYDHFGQLTEVVNSSGVPLRFGYDGAGRLSGWTDRNGTDYGYVYDGAGRCVQTTGSDGFLDGALAYDPERRVTTVTDSLGNVSTFQLNDRGQVVREVDPLGHAVTRTWDAFDRLLSQTDPLGRTTTYGYDRAGDLVAVTRPDGALTEITYNAQRRPVTVVGFDGALWRRDYDARGNPTVVIDPAEAATRYGYDERGYLSEVTDALGNVTTVSCDAAGLATSVTDPSGATTSYARDHCGRIVAVTDALGAVTRYGYTADGKPGWTTLPDGATESWAYDPEGNLSAHVDPTGATTRFEVTHFDLPSARVDPDGTRIEFGYDTELRLTSVTNPQGLTWRYDYDRAGRLVAETDFNGRTLSYAHDAAGQLAARANGVGQTISYDHDVLGNVVVQYAPEGQTRFTYDRSGRLVRAQSPDADLSIERDVLGQVVAESVNGTTIRHSYDPVGRRVGTQTPSGARSRWDYDAREQPTALHAGGHSLHFGHDAAGRHIDLALASSPVGLHLTQAYDANNRLVAQTLTTGTVKGTTSMAEPRLIARRGYEYRTDGLLAAIDDTASGRRTFDLDRVGRITEVSAAGWNERYAYDGAGNLTHAGWTDPNPESPTSHTRGEREYTGTLIRRAGTMRYEHDRQGRVVLRQLKQRSTKPWTWRYTWNSDDRLVAVTTPDGSRWAYSYDPLGRRIAKRRLDKSGAVIERVDFTWDGVHLAEQTHTSTDGVARTSTWNYHPGSFTPICQIDQAEVDRRFYTIVADLTGAPTELVTPHGHVAWHTRTTIWGTTTHTSATGVDCPLRFPGQYHDPETGDHYNNQRYYDPTTARYHSTDPLGLAPADNPHTYVTNPTNQIDPLGLAPSRCGWMSPSEFAAAEAHDVRNMYRTAEGATHTGQHGAGLRAGARELRRRVRENGYLPEINEQLLKIANQWESRARGIDHGMQRGR